MAEELFTEGQDYPAQSFSSDVLDTSDEATEAAVKAFGIRYLFPWQRLVISNILDSSVCGEIEDSVQNDVVCRGRQIVLLPTGAGKSLCFLTPALLLNGPTLVLYPLLALMADQQRRMEDGNLGCVVFKGGQDQKTRLENLEKIKNGSARVILANPEVLQSKELVQQLKECKIAHIAIDEAHCVCEWGDTFRPAYLTLGQIIKDLEVKVVTAFTATASPPVLQRVAEVLFDGEAHLVQSSSDRANIHYEVRYAWAKKKAVLKACTEFKKPLIVFCSSRKRTEDMARLLSSYFGHEKVRFYHAGLSKEEKQSVEKWFFDSQDGLLTATCAYGMGMDKGNIYSVIHLDAPEHLENFIQEAGRAGRKGDNVNSVLIWSHADDIKWKQAKEGSREKIMGGYAHTTNCRRQFMMSYLSGETVACSGCDLCDARARGKTVSQESEDGAFAFNVIKKNRRLLTKDEAVSLLTQKFNQRDLNYYKMNVWEARDVSEILSQLLSSRKITVMTGLWKNRLDIKKAGYILRHLSKKAILRLARLRHRHRHLLRELELVRERFF